MRPNRTLSTLLLILHLHAIMYSYEYRTVIRVIPKKRQLSTILPARCNHERRKCCSKPVDCFTRVERQSGVVKKIVKEMSERKRKRVKYTQRGTGKKVEERGEHVWLWNILYKSYFLPSFTNDQLHVSSSTDRFATPSCLYWVVDKNRPSKYLPPIKLDICQTTV